VFSPLTCGREQTGSQSVGVSRVETKKAEVVCLGLVRSPLGVFGLHTVVSSCEGKTVFERKLGWGWVKLELPRPFLDWLPKGADNSAKCQK
jgi:hypothetical protein